MHNAPFQIISQKMVIGCPCVLLRYRFCLYLMNEMRRNLIIFFFFCISNAIKTIDLPSFTGFTIDNIIHEKITQFWLAEKGVQFFCYTSANL